MTHHIGLGSSFDVDMQTIEMFIRAKNNPDDELSQLALFDYYKSKLLSYWMSLTENIFSDNVNDVYKYDQGVDPNSTAKIFYNSRHEERKKRYGELMELPIADDATNIEDIEEYYYQLGDGEDITFDDYRRLVLDEEYDDDNFSGFGNETIHGTERMLSRYGSVIPGRYIRFIRENFDEYKTQFLILLEKTVSIFNETKQVNMDQFIYLFNYVTRLMCLNPNAYILKFWLFRSNLEHFDIYLLPNNVGLFGFNSYMYAFVNGILLIGVPDQNATFDDIYGCAYTFMDHDFVHSEDIETTLERYGSTNTLRDVYYKILGSELTVHEKEMLVFAMWGAYHENNIDITQTSVDELIDEVSSTEELDEISVKYSDLYSRLEIESEDESDYMHLILYSYLFIKRNFM